MSLMLRLSRQELRRRNPHPLTKQQKWNHKQREYTHEHAKYAKRYGGPIFLDPCADEKRPREADDGAETGHHDEAVAGNRVVRVEELQT